MSLRWAFVGRGKLLRAPSVPRRIGVGRLVQRAPGCYARCALAAGPSGVPSRSHPREAGITLRAPHASRPAICALPLEYGHVQFEKLKMSREVPAVKSTAEAGAAPRPQQLTKPPGSPRRPEDPRCLF